MAALPHDTIAVVGEALIDLVETGDDEPRSARPGGSPYNVAIGLARLGRPASFVGRFSHDPLGLILRNHAARSAVELSLSVEAHEPSTIALLELHEGIAHYRFGVEGTADFRFSDAELASIPDDIAAVHFGSLASWLAPGDAAIARRVAELRATRQVLVTYDPNVRPHLQPDGAKARVQIEHALRLAHLVKTSEEDIAWLHPGADVDDVARSWLELGPDVVVVTRGGAGSSAFIAAGEVHRPVWPTTIVDTVGAGDAFMSGLLDALAAHGALHPQRVAGLDAAGLEQILDSAALVASITCSRAGANPPRRAELDAAHD